MKNCKNRLLSSLSLQINSAAIHERQSTPKTIQKRSKSVTKELKETGTSVSPRQLEDDVSTNISFDYCAQEILKLFHNDDSIIEMPSYLEESPRKPRDVKVLRARNLSSNTRILSKPKMVTPLVKRAVSKSGLKRGKTIHSKKGIKTNK